MLVALSGSLYDLYSTIQPTTFRPFHQPSQTIYDCINNVSSYKNTLFCPQVRLHSPLARFQTDENRPIKASTGITGLEAHPDPLPALQKTYTSTLQLLSSLPSTSVYRQATEAITKHRLQTVESSGQDVAKFESALGSMAEVVLEEAQAEQQLVGNMIEWKG